MSIFMPSVIIMTQPAWLHALAWLSPPWTRNNRRCLHERRRGSDECWGFVVLGKITGVVGTDSSMNDCSQRTLAVHRIGEARTALRWQNMAESFRLRSHPKKSRGRQPVAQVRFGKGVNPRAASNLREIPVLRRTRVRRSSDRSSSRPTSKSGLVEMCAEEDRRGSRLPP